MASSQHVIRSIGLLLVFMTSYPFMISPVGGIFRYSQCVQVGQLQSLPAPPANQKASYTIGGKLFEIKDSDAMDRPLSMKGDFAKMFPYVNESRGCKNDGYKLDPEIVLTYSQDYCPPDVEIRAYLVHQNGRVLRGWLHFEVEITGGDEMEYIYLQIRDEAFNAIGEFIRDEDVQCNSSVEYLVQPSRYQYLPCSGTGYREAKTSEAIFIAKRSQYKQYDLDKSKIEPFLPTKNLTKGIHFIWRLSEYWCNRHLRFRVDASVYSTKTRDIFYSKVQTLDDSCLHTEKLCPMKRKVTDYWLHPKWFGAADIKLEGELNCSLAAVDYKTGELTEGGKTWLKKTSEVTLSEDYLHPNKIQKLGNRYVFQSCQVDPGASESSEIVTFGGRCNGLISKEVNRENFQGCEVEPQDLDPEDVDTSNFTDYTEYAQSLFQARRRQCDQKCVEPDFSSEADLIEIQGYPDNKKNERKYKVSWKTLRSSRLGVMSSTFWYTRKYHGSLCIFFTLFLLPVSNFIIRYYKETFMDSWCLGCPPYFWIHMFVCFAIPTLYLSGYTAMEHDVDNFGRSTTKVGSFHRICGSMFIWLFLIMVFIGGIRPLVESSRLLCMIMHSVTGFFLYILALSLVISSSFIPASPSLKECAKDGFPTGVAFAVWATLVWFLIDLAFHCVLTYSQRSIDHSLDIRDRAGDGFILTPILPAVSMTDFTGSYYRKIALIVYISLSCIITWSTLIQLWKKERPEGCSEGEMSCNLSEIRPGMEASPFGCSDLSLRFYARFCERYIVIEKSMPTER